MKQPPNSIEVWKWPECIAFFERLGIPFKRDRTVTVTLDYEGVVVVNHEYLGEDMADE